MLLISVFLLVILLFSSIVFSGSFLGLFNLLFSISCSDISSSLSLISKTSSFFSSSFLLLVSSISTDGSSFLIIGSFNVFLFSSFLFSFSLLLSSLLFSRFELILDSSSFLSEVTNGILFISSNWFLILSYSLSY